VQIYNDAFLRLLGDRHPAQFGRPAAEDELEPAVWSLLGEVLRDGRSHSTPAESSARGLDGRRHEAFHTFTGMPVRAADEDDTLVAVLVVGADTTGQLLAQRREGTLAAMAGIDPGLLTPEEVCREALARVALNRRDVPFALVYTRADPRHPEARLTAAAGLRAASLRPPASVTIAGARWWPRTHRGAPGTVAPAPGDQVRRIAVPEEFADLAGGPWPEPVHQVAVTRLWAGTDLPVGLLLVGLSPRLAVDGGYLAFVGEVGRHLSLLATAAFERGRAQERAAGLVLALDSNRQIGTAVGVLMALHKVTKEQAFDLLKWTSHNTNRKIREVADDVVETGTLPPLRQRAGKPR
jgi:hypothetical protein